MILSSTRAHHIMFTPRALQVDGFCLVSLSHIVVIIMSWDKKRIVPWEEKDIILKNKNIGYLADSSPGLHVQTLCVM